jgi:hypothetical protein
MLVKIPEGTWCKFYDQEGSHTHFVSSETLCLVVEKTSDERNRDIYTVLIGNDLFEVPKEEVIQY